MFEFNLQKAVQALNFFAIKEGGIINKMKAIKLIWLADRAHLRKYCRPIIFDEYYAMQFGPVPSGVKDLAENNSFIGDNEKEYRNSFIRNIDNLYIQTIAAVDNDVFSETDMQIMQKVYDAFGNKSEFQLSEFSHIFPEWQKFESRLNRNFTRFTMDYIDFFKNPTTGTSNFFNEPNELLNLSLEVFLENKAIYHDFNR